MNVLHHILVHMKWYSQLHTWWTPEVRILEKLKLKVRRVQGIPHSMSANKAWSAEQLRTRRFKQNAWSLLQMLLDLAALNNMPSGFSRVHWDEDYRVCTGYNRALVIATNSFLPQCKRNHWPATSCHTSPHFTSHEIRRQNLKACPVLSYCIHFGATDFLSLYFWEQLGYFLNSAAYTCMSRLKFS
jgi:hypothetical protein